MTSAKRNRSIHVRRKRTQFLQQNNTKQESNSITINNEKIRIFCNHINPQTGDPCGYHSLLKRYYKSHQNSLHVRHACSAYWAKSGKNILRNINYPKKCNYCTRKFCIRKANKREIAEYTAKNSSNKKLKENMIYIYCYHVNKNTSQKCGVHMASTAINDPKISTSHRCIADVCKKFITRYVDAVYDKCNQNCTGPCIISAKDQICDEAQSNTNMNEMHNEKVIEIPQKRRKMNVNTNVNENMNLNVNVESNLSYAQKTFKQYLPFDKYYDLFNDKSYADMEFLDIMMDETFLREEIGILNVTDIKIIIIQWKNFDVYQKEFQTWLKIHGNPFFPIREMLERKAIFTRFDLRNIVVGKESFDSVFDKQIFYSKVLWDYVQTHFI